MRILFWLFVVILVLFVGGFLALMAIDVKAPSATIEVPVAADALAKP